MKNIDDEVVRGFGDEWQRFDQRALPAEELEAIFQSYFHIFPWEALPPDARGLDAGCGSGRWASLVAPRVGKLHCVDASSQALNVARRNLAALPNVEFHHASVGAMPFPDGSLDFGYSLGVLHHIPDTAGGIAACVAKLKPGAPFLLYLYYAFDNRPAWYRAVWKTSEVLRAVLSRSPAFVRHLGADLAAVFVYWPLARLARLLERLGMKVDSFPLSFYRDRDFYVMRTDALDRFGTRLEKRFTRAEMQAMMESAGLRGVTFSETAPYWCAVGFSAR